MASDYYKSATEWLELPDEFSRSFYHPRKVTQAEMNEWRKSMSPRQIVARISRIDKAREQIKRFDVSKKQMVDVIEKATGERIEKTKKNEGKINKMYKEATMERGSGHVEDLYWYTNVMEAAGINEDLIDRLDDISSQLNQAELDALYHELPDLTLYYQSSKKTGHSQVAEDTTEEWSEKLKATLDYYESKIEGRYAEEFGDDDYDE